MTLSAQQTQDGFIVLSLDGDYRPFSEDRLTQLTAAGFNHSRIFRACFLKFLCVRNPNKTTNARAETQSPVWRSGKRGRLDLVITRGNRTVAVVENKVDAPLHPRQLKFYSQVATLETAKKIALVRHYFEARGFDATWKILHWRDFYLALRERVDGRGDVVLTDLSKGVLQKWQKWLS